ncbi:MAG: metal transporter [Thermodesulfobacteriota bacterium]
MSHDEKYPFAPFLETSTRMVSAFLDAYRVSMLYSTGLTRYVNDFLEPFYVACGSFMEEERKKVHRVSPETNFEDYSALLRFNAQIGETGSLKSENRAAEYHAKEARRFIVSLFNTFLGGPGEKVDEYMARKAALLQRLVVDYPDAIRSIEPEYGFHFDDGTYRLAAETDRMWLYQVLPTEPGVAVREDCKPIVIAHPYVLGPNIIAFLPGERKSYVHAFANEGIPTYARIIKNIWEAEAVQVMSGEDDARDTAYFCRVLKEKHGKPVTLNGFCQGGFICLADVLSRELDGLVDALISCVAPMDGTRSKGLVDYLEHISPRFRDLAYARKTLPSGHEVIDGRVMSWVYKLKSIEREAPVFTYYRDIEMFETMLEKGIEGIGKTAAAINYWLIYDRTDLPPAITQMSFDSYTIPISAAGDLPFKLFGRRLNFDYLREKGIRFQICYAGKDDLVDPPAALAPRDFVDVELTEFPKGHAAIATSWSDPSSDYALHKRYPNGQRGPVRFQLDLDEELSAWPGSGLARPRLVQA